MSGERKEVAQLGRKIYDKRLVAGTWGNISIRLEEHQNQFAITPSGMDYLKLEPKDIVILNLKGEKIQGKKNPSTEKPLHRYIYKNRKDVNAIIHTHSTFASAVACTRKKIPPIIEDMVQIIGGSVRTAKYELPGSEDLAKSVLTALRDRNAALLANHGAVSVGPDGETSLKTAEILEKSAKIFLFSKLIGAPQKLSEEDVETMKKIYKSEYGQEG
ncbi:hypothetical protein AKJ50_00865 [candidate division MSBL1 archaeon SCGC-AAA382A13]|uniref:Class II aldolase/adducin N-terminal domain-containing protein n=2 Tax=candidate division MSBL1 TaxID=215777 RepID=A0A133VG14_9EURY|nr:hypothetical protein AKJ49_00915 [candidate division MSBL1 archaeon SCGC-AAA382A03]KXB05486.1 hypothetical protein AKJ50_00865 [candidate division MSBL1 archaeon SCGC-AAA382A13]